MIKIDIKAPLEYTAEDLHAAVVGVLPTLSGETFEIKILKRALDINEASISYKMTVALSFDEERERGLLKMRKRVSPYSKESLSISPSRLDLPPVVVGGGPCGLFAALVLSLAGARPILIERGLPVEERTRSVSRFITRSELDVESNVQFGEGGAGTFSDGKLKVGSHDKYKNFVLDEFISAGACEEIAYSQTAHLGTDMLPSIVKSIRKRIISLGGEVIFRARLTDVKIKDGAVEGITYQKGGEAVELPTSNLVLATGHSARDTFALLSRLQIPMVAKGFGIGVRIEHPREYINGIVYGEGYPKGLETASYHLVTHLEGGRSVYSFCMCPGGTVVPATSNSSSIVTNGMSAYSRMGDNSNAAFLVSVTPSDFASTDPLAGLELQSKIERAAYNLTESYKAPATTLESFKEGRAPTLSSSVKPSYPIGVEPFSPEAYLPEYITDSLRAAISNFDGWLGGFYYGDAIMCGPETRTTSPVRVLRGESYEALGVSGLYPAGEGAGYSGGIISSAVDGVRVALAILSKNSK